MTYILEIICLLLFLGSCTGNLLDSDNSKYSGSALKKHIVVQFVLSKKHCMHELKYNYFSKSFQRNERDLKKSPSQ